VAWPLLARAKPQAWRRICALRFHSEPRGSGGVITSRRLVASLGSFGPAGISANVAAGCALDQREDLFLDRLNPAGRLGPLGSVPLDQIDAVVTALWSEQLRWIGAAKSERPSSFQRASVMLWVSKPRRMSLPLTCFLSVSRRAATVGADPLKLTVPPIVQRV
jgi:hypothetical protein